MAMNGKAAAFGAGGLLLMALAAIALVVTGGRSASARDNLILGLQQECEKAGGALYTAKNPADAPAICHKKGAPPGTDEPLREWETVLFVEGQL